METQGPPPATCSGGQPSPPVPHPGSSVHVLRFAAGRDFDIIIALTESLLAGIEKDGEVKLLGCYVQSALNWAVTVGADSAIKSYADLAPQVRAGGKNLKGLADPATAPTFAISRHGSGSETMAYVMADKLGWPTDSSGNAAINFKVCGNFAEMTRCVNLPKGDPDHCDAQMWEWFTSKPSVVAGKCKYIESVVAETDEPILTPW